MRRNLVPRQIDFDPSIGAFIVLGAFGSMSAERSLASASSQPDSLPKNENLSNSGSLFWGQNPRDILILHHFLGGVVQWLAF